MNRNQSDKLKACYESVKKRVDFKPKIALVLGSGLGDYADTMQIEDIVEYKDIEGFVSSTVEGHKGRFVFGYVGDVPVVCMQGRVHYYEGYDMSDVVLPVRLMGLMGAKVLFLTNASGGVNQTYKPGDFMLIQDHISMVQSPLRGENLSELGVRFPDMSEAYDGTLRALIKEQAAKLGIPLQEGVYIQLSGPQYETPAEIRMVRMLGADAVGMSTACEAIAANHMHMKVCGISCITNMAAGVLPKPLSHSEVQETADRVSAAFQALVTESILAIGEKGVGR